MRPLRSRSWPVSLTPAQRTAIVTAAERLPEASRHSFTIRIETKLAMRRRSTITDELASIIDNILIEMREIA